MSKPAKKTARSSRFSLKIGSFVFLPSHGLTVYAGPETTTVVGIDISTHVFQSTQRKDERTSIPDKQLATSGLTPVNNIKVLQAIIDELGAKPQKPKGAWQAQFRYYNDLMRVGDMASMVHLLHRSMSEYRSSAFKNQALVQVPEEVNYTLKSYINDSLNALAPMFQMMLGKSADEARDMLMRGVLQKGYANQLSLAGQVKHNGVLSDGEFQRFFGISKADARDNSRIKRLVTPMYFGHRPRGAAPTDLATVRKDIEAAKAAARARRLAEQAANSDKKNKRGSRGHTGTKSKGSSRNPIPSHMRNAYNELEGFIPTTQHVKAAFNLAARHLKNPEDLKIAARFWFVKRAHKYNAITLCYEFNIEPGDLKQRLETIKNAISAAAEKEDSKSFWQVKMPIPSGIK